MIIFRESPFMGSPSARLRNEIFSESPLHGALQLPVGGKKFPGKTPFMGLSNCRSAVKIFLGKPPSWGSPNFGLRLEIIGESPIHGALQVPVYEMSSS